MNLEHITQRTKEYLSKAYPGWYKVAFVEHDSYCPFTDTKLIVVDLQEEPHASDVRASASHV